MNPAPNGQSGPDQYRSSCDLEKMKNLIIATKKQYPMCKDFLSSCGLTLEELNLTIRCLSLVMEHETVVKHTNGNKLVFSCKLGKQHCPFCLKFTKENGLWYLNRRAENSVSTNCSPRKFPEICCSQHFLEFFITDWMKNNGKTLRDIKTNDVLAYLRGRGMADSHKRTVDRVVCSLTEKSAKKVLESEQKIEDYVTHLNCNGQYGALLYDTGELVVPAGVSNRTIIKHCPLEGNPAFCVPLAENGGMFWDNLEEVKVRSEKESVLYTFQAVENAVKAFPFSFPVVSLDACFIKCPHTTAVLMTASFMTTEGHILSMCHGTAPRETINSWAFFLRNLRQAMTFFCGDFDWKNIVFMSDRHDGIISGIKNVFPESHHFFVSCIFFVM